MTAARHTRPSQAAVRGKEANTEVSASFEHRGATYTVPHPLDMPVAVLEAEDELEAVRLIVGPEQWRRYKESGATIRDFKEFADKVAQAQGHADAGN
jgi:hypothetical protein